MRWCIPGEDKEEMSSILGRTKDECPLHGTIDRSYNEV